MVVVTDKDYALRVKNHTTVETIHGYCTYEGGYFDVKYMTKEFLADAAEKGSEPTRNAFLKAYFLQGCPVDGYMKLHAVGEVIYSIYRMVLQENEILFPCNRRLEDFVARISAQTDRLVSLGKVAARSQDIEDVKAFVDSSF